VSFALRIYEETPFNSFEQKYVDKVQSISGFLISEDLLLTRTLVRFTESKSPSYSANGEFFQSIVNCILTKGFAGAIHLVRILLKREVDGLDSSDLLFRENSTVNGIIIFLCKKFGTPYAATILNPIISKILHSGESFEIDPRRISTIAQNNERKSVEKNEQAFQSICRSLVEAIVKSINDIPLYVFRFCFD
jgi:hypothetical protein